MNDDIIYIYCDGGCRVHTTKIGGYGIVLKYGKMEKHIFGYEHDTTNNKMELLSAITALQAINIKTKKTIVTTDSKYVVEGITNWIDGWKKNKWKTSSKKPVANTTLWKQLYEEKIKFTSIEFVHCYGHKDNKYNNIADSLATKSVDTLTSGSVYI